MRDYIEVPILIKFLAFVCIAWTGMFFISVTYSFFDEIFFSLFNFKTNNLSSPLGVLIVVFWLAKGIVSYSVIKRRKWAYKFGLIDAGGSILIYMIFTVHQFIYFNPSVTRKISSEIVLFIIYFLLMMSMNKSPKTQ